MFAKSLIFALTIASVVTQSACSDQASRGKSDSADEPYEKSDPQVVPFDLQVNMQSRFTDADGNFISDAERPNVGQVVALTIKGHKIELSKPDIETRDGRLVVYTSLLGDVQFSATNSDAGLRMWLRPSQLDLVEKFEPTTATAAEQVSPANDAYIAVSDSEVSFAVTDQSTKLAANYGKVQAWVGEWTSVRIDGIDAEVELAQKQITVEEGYGVIDSKKYGKIRVLPNNRGSATFILKPSQISLIKRDKQKR